MTAQRVVLVMICGNEEGVIKRCLEAALPFVDGAVLCCNGSDSTRDVAKAVAESLGKPLEIWEQPWFDFGHNRTLSARAAESFGGRQGFDLDQTWFLFLDADMVLRGELGELVHDSYMIVQKGGGSEWENIRLARASKCWSCHEPTHEYWQAALPATQGRMPGLWIDDRGDGGNKSDKFERDIRLLTERLAREPTHTRTRFYLAESYFYSNKFRQAQEHYHYRAESGGFEAERWFARFREGCCLIRRGMLEQAAGVLLQAFQERPTRAEPLFELGRAYVEAGQHQLGAMVLERAFRIEKPGAEDLFVEGYPYQTGIAEYLVRTWFYTGKHEQARRLGEQLLRVVGGDAPRAAHVAQLLSWYVQALPRVSEGRFNTGYPSHPDADGTTWHEANPSIAQVGDELLRTVRLVNYTQQGGRNYVSSSPDGKIRTRTLLRAGADLGSEIDEGIIKRLGWPEGEILGLEDVRLFEFRGGVWFTATCCQVPGATSAQVVLGRLSKATVTHLVPLTWPGNTACEKNWLPMPTDTPVPVLRMIYSWAPFRVLEVEVFGGVCKPVETAPTLPMAHRWRGSARPVHVDGRWIAIVHEVARRPDRNVYLHRFVELSNGPVPSVLGYSEAFRLGEAGVEYVAGAEVIGNELEITYGVEDREARWLRISVDQLARVLPRMGLEPVREVASAAE